MKNTDTLINRSPRFMRATRARMRRAARRSSPIALSLMLLCQGLVFGAVAPVAAQAQTRSGNDVPSPIAQVGEGSRVQPISTTVANFEALAQEEARERRRGTRLPKNKGGGVTVEQNFSMPVPEGVNPLTNEPAVSLDSDVPVGPLAPSQAPQSSFQAQPDIPKPDGPQAGFSFIPPDTIGAVGLDKLIVTLNNVYTVQNKATGAPLSTVSTDTFWNAGSATPRGTGYFDPKTVYDPFNNRFIATILSNGISPNSRMHIAVSQTSDPQGSWFIATFGVGNVGGANRGADFPCLAFNKNWITISLNIFQSVAPGSFVESDIYFIDYPPARSGTFGGSLFRLGGASTIQPAVTYSTTEENMYTTTLISTAAFALLAFTPDGPDADLVQDLVIISTAIPYNSGGTQVNLNLGEIMPQAPPTVGTPRRIQGNDGRFINTLFRNGTIWTSHHFGVRGAGNVTVRTAAQAYQLTPAAAVLQRLRVEDPTATDTNGGKWYAFAAVSVNRGNDAVIGYTQFASNQFASAGYSVHNRTDPPNTINDPFIYQAGLGYYDKDFTASGTDTGGNRWGDYSFTTVDPSNDSDLWTIQELANPQVGTGNPAGTNNNSGRWNTWWAKIEFPGLELNISEFRLRGPNGATDEFVEIYNFAPVPVTVRALDGSTGYAVAASDGIVRCIIPNGQIIPAGGHFLCANSAGYSLGSYPAGVGTTATSDANITLDIADNVGIALFRTSNPANFNTTTRLDAAGSTAEANTLYKEGSGYPAITPFNIDYTFFRDNCGKSGSVTQLGGCPTDGLPRDTGDNAVDFVYADTFGVNNGPGTPRLGAPGPENLSSPILRNATMQGFNLDSTKATSAPPNRVRVLTPDSGNNSTFGTLDIRRRIVNNTGSAVTRLRFRVVDVTVFPSALTTGFADLRARTSGIVLESVNDPANCAAAQVPPASSPVPPCTVTVQGTTLEMPPPQPNGGGFNSTLSVGSVALTPPLAPGASINVRFLLGVQQTGTFKFLVNIEALP